MSEDKKFIDMCAVCKQGVTKLDMVYKKGRVFHPQCFVNFGSSFPTPNVELTSLGAKTRIELVQMKNLKVRTDQGLIKPNRGSTKKTKKSSKSKKKHAKKKSKLKWKSKKVKTRTRKAKSKKKAKRMR